MNTNAKIINKCNLSRNIIGFEIKSDTVFQSRIEPGAHIGIQLSNGEYRQYSLFTTTGSNYHIAVQREETGRGGSKEICDKLEIGDKITISEPRNNFPLKMGSDHYILLGAGIGVTPIISMAEALLEAGKSFEFHYFSRDEESAAFAKYLTERNYLKALLHLDTDQDRFDLGGFFKEVRPNTEVYMCGPEGFMDAVSAVTQHWPPSTINKEHFAASSNETVDDSAGFTVVLYRSGKVVEVEPGQSIIAALMKEGVTSVRTSCMEGVCGSCICDVVSGAPIHNDVCLTEEEKESGKLIVPCVSRAATDEVLILDI